MTPGRLRLVFSGIVQGVGFRPYIYRLAVEQRLAGFVHNRPDGVAVEVEGPREALDGFMFRVVRELPPLARVSACEVSEIEPRGENGFRIVQSGEEGRPAVHIPPDTATCPQCLAELFDPSDRRYRYPFINCTNCGPRLTIITGIPYDRTNTSMQAFPLCDRCRREYEDPRDRRFHAEPNACPVCGPALSLLDEQGREIPCTDPVEKTLELLKAGLVVAVKGLGGFHLCVDASNSEAVLRLRNRKFREEKPLAIMVRDLASARRLAWVSPEEERLLGGGERPIVLLARRDTEEVSAPVAPGMPNLGVMLPYTPLHHLLLSGDLTALVMTSANQTDEPICTGNSEALKRLKGIADCYLVHNRDIVVRCDDSVALVAAGEPRLLRRSRGYAPQPVVLKGKYPPVLALGAHLKASVCVLREDCAFLSPHIGDLETPEARDFLNENIRLMQRIAECDPRIVACDLHPGYYTTSVARKLGIARVVEVQHHHAHVVSCMAENRLSGRVIGLSMDGTGYGTDGRVWGGEFLVADETGFERLGHLRYFPLIGGDAAARQPWRPAAALLMECLDGRWREVAGELDILPPNVSAELVEAMVEKRVQTIWTSSLGRVFDAVACLIGIRRVMSFEGQAAMELEGLCTIEHSRVLPFEIVRNREAGLVLDLLPAVREIVRQRMQGRSAGELSGDFHLTLVHAFAAMAEEIRGLTSLNRVCLSGGCFQNRVLLEGCIEELKERGFEVYTHRLVPANDGGIALGQAVVAAAAGLQQEGRK
jgi:hydrogenase maturation protein HypF